MDATKASLSAQLLEVCREMTSTVSLGQLLHQIIQAAVQLTSAESAGILLGDEGQSELRFVAVAGQADRLWNIPVPIDHSIAGVAFITGQPVNVSDAGADPRYYPIDQDQLQFKARSMG